MGKSLNGKELGTGITQRKDGRYSAKFKSKSGKRVEKYFDKLAEARKWLAEAKYEDSHGDISSSADMTVDAWFNYWISEIKNYNRFLFILRTGVRSSELRGLKWDDIDFQNRIIHIRRNVTHDSNNNRFITGELKTNSGQRDIPMTQTDYDLLMAMKHQQASYRNKVISFEFADHVFLNRNGKLLPNSNYDRYLEKICDKAGIERISMHTLRHTFAARCIESGMKPKTLQKILGHANISMTMDLYVHVTEDEKEKEMQQFEQMCRMA